MSSINLSKGENINLTKVTAGATKFIVGCGWDAAPGNVKHDLDASIFILTAAKKLADNKNFVFYGNTTDPNGAIVHSGDNRTGEGDGDDETLTIDMSKLPADTEELIIVTSIHEEHQPKTINFGQVRNSYVRILNGETQAEIAKADLNEDFSGARAVSFGRLYKNGGEWKFKNDEPVTEPNGLEAFVAKYEI